MKWVTASDSKPSALLRAARVSHLTFTAASDSRHTCNEPHGAVLPHPAPCFTTPAATYAAVIRLSLITSQTKYNKRQCSINLFFET